MSAWEGSEWQLQQEKDKRLLKEPVKKERLIHSDEICLQCGGIKDWRGRNELCEKCYAIAIEQSKEAITANQTKMTAPIVVATEGQTLVPLDAKEITRLMHALTLMGAHQVEHADHVLFQKFQKQLELLNGTDIPLET